jgi:hypothetical protein
MARHQGSISPTFYKQLVRSKIPKVQKYADDLTVFFVLLGSAGAKVLIKNVSEIGPKHNGSDGIFYAFLND